jgi:hypothetical protein
LNDSWPSGSRPIFSQGDVAVGRINRKDVATILADCIDTPEASGKTFEGFSIEGYSDSQSNKCQESKISPAFASYSQIPIS